MKLLSMRFNSIMLKIAKYKDIINRQKHYKKTILS